LKENGIERMKAKEKEKTLKESERMNERERGM
jgi:hypothetical protein